MADVSSKLLIVLNGQLRSKCDKITHSVTKRSSFTFTVLFFRREKHEASWISSCTTIQRPRGQFRGVSLSLSLPATLLSPSLRVCAANDRGKSHLRPRLGQINIIRKHASSLYVPRITPKTGFLSNPTRGSRDRLRVSLDQGTESPFSSPRTKLYKVKGKAEHIFYVCANSSS